MRLPKGVHTVKKKRRDGSIAVYHYDRSTGTRLPEPTDPGFRAALAAAKAPIGRHAPGTLGALLTEYRRSPEWTGKKHITHQTQRVYLEPLEKLAHLKVSDVRRQHILTLRDSIAASRGRGAANGFAQVAGMLFSWARDRGWIDYSPADRIKRLKGGELPAWTDEMADLAIERLPEHLRRAVILGRYTGQRGGDLCG
jgi:hypothetical protein